MDTNARVHIHPLSFVRCCVGHKKVKKKIKKKVMKERVTAGAEKKSADRGLPAHLYAPKPGSALGRTYVWVGADRVVFFYLSPSRRCCAHSFDGAERLRRPLFFVGKEMRTAERPRKRRDGDGFLRS